MSGASYRLDHRAVWQGKKGSRNIFLVPCLLGGHVTRWHIPIDAQTCRLLYVDVFFCCSFAELPTQGATSLTAASVRFRPEPCRNNELVLRFSRFSRYNNHQQIISIGASQASMWPASLRCESGSWMSGVCGGHASELQALSFLSPHVAIQTVPHATGVMMW